MYYLPVNGKKNVSVLGKHFSSENQVCRGGLVLYPFLSGLDKHVQGSSDLKHSKKCSLPKMPLLTIT